ncbi:MAG: hypothetical protein RBS57_02260 [Desulforhabdus sp.]|jgi:hypothetical protein|nr:hypothetical protein [Desulforhabdus sp.]
MGTVNANGKLQYRCTKCDKVHMRSCSDLVWQLSESKQKPFGEQKYFVSAWKESCDCGAEISCQFLVRGYPFNCLDGEELQISGAELLQPCNIGIKESIFLSSMGAALTR